MKASKSTDIRKVLSITFHTEDVKSILADRKTSTRKLVTFLSGKNPFWSGYIKDGLMLYNGTNEPCIKKAPYSVGDILYVRETWKCMKVSEYDATADIMYKAGGDRLRMQLTYGKTDSINRDEFDRFIKKGFSNSEEWKPSATMPKEVARIWLKVINIRLERLQNITVEDCKKEGIWDDSKTYCEEYTENLRKVAYPKVFSRIWDSELSKSKKEKYCWQNNPWVWVIDFERCGEPEKERSRDE